VCVCVCDYKVIPFFSLVIIKKKIVPLSGVNIVWCLSTWPPFGESWCAFCRSLIPKLYAKEFANSVGDLQSFHRYIFVKR
jgi:thiol-disulfide isomerase/thioredoxin